MEETITITRAKYDQLVDDSMKLLFLENGGVDNWEWYDEALATYRKWKGEEEDEEDD